MTQLSKWNQVAFGTSLTKLLRRHWPLFILLFFGLAARLYGVWCYQYSRNPDYATVALMAKHMAEGRDFPVFFYGQPYMGSLEPAISALFCRLFGWNEFTVCLGTAFLGFLLLLVVYIWAKDALDQTAGLSALAFCIIGPEIYFAYMVSPRGGYAVTVLLSAVILWLTCRFIKAEPLPPARRFAAFCLLGFLAGLGWWCDQLIVIALITACLLVIIRLRTRIFMVPVVAGSCGFLLGSLPWWVWNATNEWASFGFMGALGQSSFSMELHHLSLERMPELLDLMKGPVFLRPVVIEIFILFAVLALWLLISTLWRKRAKGVSPDSAGSYGITREGIQGILLRRVPPAVQFAHGAPLYFSAALLFCLVFVYVLCLSSFAEVRSPRYLLPLFPAFAVIIGTVTSYLVKRLRYGLGWLPILLIIGWQFQTLPEAYKLGQSNAGTWKAAQDIGRCFRQEKIDTLFASYHFSNWLNVALREEFCCCSLEGERYSPYEKQAELTDNIAVMDYPWLSSFFTNVNAKAKCIDLGICVIFCDFSFPQEPLHMIPRTKWAYAQDLTGSNAVDRLTDLNIDTHWWGYTGGSTSDCLHIAFQEPESVCCVRVLSKDGFYPESWEVKGLDPMSGKWIDLMPHVRWDRFFYSGPRLYWNGTGLRMESRFEPATVSAIRIIFYETNNRDLEISELQILGPALDSEVPSESESIELLIDLLKQRGITTLYSDRWVANQVAMALPNVKAEVERAIFQRTIQTSALYRQFVTQKRKPHAMTLSPSCALLVRTENAPLCRETLSLRKVKMRETVVVPWTLFDFQPGQWHPAYKGRIGLYWEGFACFTADRLAYAKNYASDLVEEADRLTEANTERAEYEELLTTALSNQPDYQPALIRLAKYYRKRGREREASGLEKMYTELTIPQCRSHINFANGVEFLGISIEKRALHPGETTQITYFWKCPARVDVRRYSVFVHIEKDQFRFQDDHDLLEKYDLRELAYQSTGEVFREVRYLKVPNHAKPGLYDIRFGLFNPKTNERIRFRTNLPKKKRRALLPVKLDLN